MNGKQAGSVPVAIGLGSNLGDRLSNLRAGLRGLEGVLEAVAGSGVYRTAPRHVLDQPDFYNACCVGRTVLSPPALLDALRRIERTTGRLPGGPRYGPRPLDLDLLLYGDAVVDEPGLVVPHPRLRERAFVLLPLAELAGDWPVPAVGTEAVLTVGALAAGADASGIERLSHELVIT